MKNSNKLAAWMLVLLIARCTSGKTGENAMRRVVAASNIVSVMLKRNQNMVERYAHRSKASHKIATSMLVRLIAKWACGVTGALAVTRAVLERRAAHDQQLLTRSMAVRIATRIPLSTSIARAMQVAITF